MRPLTMSEKEQSTSARKQANKQLSGYRKALGNKYKSLPIGSSQKPILLRQSEAIRDVKGSPVAILLDGVEMVVNYDLFLGFIRKLKSRQVSVKMVLSSGSPVIQISHSASFYSKDGGIIEMYSLPQYQTELLKGIPVVKID